MRIGLISDTHGLMRVDALAALAEVAVILHAGDVGALSVLRELERMAPVHAVSGNVDDPALGLPASLALRLGGLRVHVSHGHEIGTPTPQGLVARYTADVIVYGHTHRPLVERVARTLVVNPGAAGPRRFHVRPSVAILQIADGSSGAEIVLLDTTSA